MEGQAKELLFLTNSLSQLSNKESIIQLFIERMNGIFGVINFKWYSERPQNSDKTLEVGSGNKKYGYVLLSSSNEIEKEDLSLIKNEIRFLSIILEKEELKEILHSQNLAHDTQTDEQSLFQSIKQNKNQANSKHKTLVDGIKHQSLIQNIQVAVVVHGRNTEITACNTKAQELLGLTEDQLLGKTTIDPDWHFLREDDSIMPFEEYPVNHVLATKTDLKDYIVGIQRPNMEKVVWCLVNADPVFDENDQLKQVIVTFSDIAEHKRAEQEHRDSLWFFESIDKIDRAIQGSISLDEMLDNVLDVVLSIFDCDRAYLMYPCNPSSLTWSVPFERNKPEYPGVSQNRMELPMDKDVAKTLQILLQADGPVKFGPGTDYPLPGDVSNQFGFKSFIATAIYPKVDNPWQFGMHQCAYVREWTIQEEWLFQEIGRRLAGAITSYISQKKLLESEMGYRMVFENSPVSLWEEDFSEIKKLFDDLKSKGVNDIESYFSQYPETVQKCAELVKIVDINHSALVLHEASTKKDLMTNLVHTFTEKSFETFRKELVCIWNGGAEMASDTVVKTLNGKRRDVTIYFSVCPGYEDTLSKILVSLIDITERKQAVEAIRKQEQKFRSLAENSPDNIMRYNKDCQMIYANSQPQTNDGYDESTYTGKTPLESNPNGLYDGGREEIVNFEAALKSVLSGNGTTDVEMHVPYGSGEFLTHTIRLVAEYDIEGNIIGALAFGRDVTEQQKTEQNLKLLNFALNNVYEEVYLVNEKACFDYVNDESCHVLGYSREKLLTMNVADINPDFPLERWPEHWDEIKKHSSLIFESHHKKNDGFIYPVEISANFFEYQGQGYHLTLARDITDRKQADEKLKDTARRLNEAQRLAHIGSWELDLVHDKLSWTDEIYRIFEIDPEKFGATYEAFLEAIHPDDREAVNVAYTNSLKTKSPYSIEHRLLFSDGRIKYVHEQCETYFEGDKPIVSTGTVQDITNRKLAEEALKESEWRYREIFDNVLDGLYLLEVTDEGQFRTIEVNPALEKITGIPRTFSVGKTQEEIVPPEAAELVNAKYRHCIESGIPIEEEVILDLPAGKRYFHSTLIPSSDEFGKINRIVGISRDITDRKQSEKEIQKLNQELERRVVERTVQLEATNKELEVFAYSVSHDLRAPLRSIDGFSQVLLEEYNDKIDSMGQDCLQRVRNAAQRMAQLIDDLLNLSRVNRGEMNIQQVNLSNIANEIANELHDSDPKREVKFNIQDKLIANADGRLLRIVLENLLGNAFKFSLKQATAKIEFGMFLKDDIPVYFIRDNGAGFDMKYVDKLFGAFQRLHTIDEFEGTGIGLATVQRIIHRHGGRVWAEGEVEKGATFYFTIC